MTSLSYRDFLIRQYNNELSKYSGVARNILWFLMGYAITNNDIPLLINLLKRHYPEEIKPYNIKAILRNSGDNITDNIKNILLNFLEGE